MKDHPASSGRAFRTGAIALALSSVWAGSCDRGREGPAEPPAPSASGSAAPAPAPAAPLSVRETPLAVLPAGVDLDDVQVSLDGRRFAYRFRDPASRGWRACVDGKEGESFTTIGSGFVFSRDNLHVAYLAGQAGTPYAVLDGESLRLACFTSVEDLRVSPAGGRLAVRGRDGPQSAVVLDGKVGPWFDAIATMLFSDDGEHFGYAARRGKEWFAVIDGKEGGGYDAVGSIVLAPAGGRAAFQARRGDRRLLVLDGKEIEIPGKIEGLRFDPAGRRVAYWTEKDEGAWSLHLEAGTLGPFDWPAAVTFSDDGAHCAFVGARGTERFLQLDGASRAIEGLSIFLGFDPTGERFAYIVEGPDGMRVVAGDAEGPVFEKIDQFAFGPGGLHHGYIGWRGEHLFVVADGRETGPFDDAGAPSFSPDGRRSYACARAGDESRTLLDGEVIARAMPFDAAFTPDSGALLLVFPEGDGMRIVLRRDGAEAEAKHRGRPLRSPFIPRGRAFRFEDGGRSCRFLVRDGDEIFDVAVDIATGGV
ncbi:MAG: hypothetical protein JXP34_06600 [Planctomycetes bacterium]|nr:hypothetical protein [Planctomycetota bacterium]